MNQSRRYAFAFAQLKTRHCFRIDDRPNVFSVESHKFELLHPWAEAVHIAPVAKLTIDPKASPPIYGHPFITNHKQLKVHLADRFHCTLRWVLNFMSLVLLLPLCSLPLLYRDHRANWHYRFCCHSRLSALSLWRPTDITINNIHRLP